VVGELSKVMMDTVDEGLLDIMTDTVGAVLLDAMTDTIGEELLGIVTDAIEGEFLDAMMDMAIHLGGVQTCLTAPKVIKVLLGNCHPINNGRTFHLMVSGKDLEHLQSILVTNWKGFHNTIVIMVSESIPC